MPAGWERLALDPPRAHGTPPVRARVRSLPEDFRVDEELGFAPSGEGPHVLLRVRKRGANTDWVARELARAAGCRVPDVGFAGLKDRHAITTQWFTVPAGRRLAPDWAGFSGPEFEVLEAHPHRRKLPRGALKRNHFELRLRDWSGDRAALEARIAAMRAGGVPNYFGAQRFGREGANLVRAARWVDPGEARPRENPTQRSFRLSASRSLVFNAVLAARVAEGSWARLEAGDVANLDERGSVFPVSSVDDTLGARAAALEIHPTGPLWGRGVPSASARILELEAAATAPFAPLLAMLEEAGLEQERRSLRLVPHEFEVSFDGADLECRFALAPGAYATTVLRELIEAPQD